MCFESPTNSFFYDSTFQPDPTVTETEIDGQQLCQSHSSGRQDMTNRYEGDRTIHEELISW